MKVMIIAIDGPAASGKSTTAKGVSQILDIPYLDTGAMYRAITYFVLENKIDIEDASVLKQVLDDIKIRFESENGKNEIYLKGKKVTSLIRTTAVTSHVSRISAVKDIRISMVKLQRSIGEENGCVMEGRDIGTVVFPHADFKFFLIADIEVRAKRRLKDLAELGETKSLEILMEEIEKRDKMDSSRDYSPLAKADNAIEIDTGVLSIDEQIEIIIKRVTNK
ncbi:MAG: (d)CMP kinase [Candidatus Marinimicrobia bacterium]|nr:(d)CMP kinase [Candidatus Neomarinimicrobiota bacterium]MBT3496364.1 (d)CMP kinase [Candidatus Neomarinimicrobiota bacterium]MBT3692575.1 (d)CMP kinase [Candidatus Neomarinimicrobiota bacterium]MBT3731994.1 (d)CMP kinase [Candidatus Neomarinimicrobiota bacterium]MBT4145213.1 (d)CMP kinase [Candidatus Neomarinimicrobiota bacterium]